MRGQADAFEQPPAFFGKPRSERAQTFLSKILQQ
jgi:hypothetical protein